jgi:hypothetical protein
LLTVNDKGGTFVNEKEVPQESKSSYAMASESICLEFYLTVIGALDLKVKQLLLATTIWTNRRDTSSG